MALEEEMQGLGVARYRRKLQEVQEGNRESATGYGRALMSDKLEAVTAAIEARVKEADTGAPGRRSVAVSTLKGLDAFTCAFCALRVVLDHLSTAGDLSPRAYAISIASLIEEQCRMAFYDKTNRPLFRQILHDRKEVRKQGPGRTRQAVKKGMKDAGVLWDNWGDAKRYQVGMALFEIVIETTGFVEVISSTSANNRTELQVKATDIVLEWVQKTIGRCELLAPEFMPMLCPPNPWEGVYGGGYISPWIKKVSLVKTRRRGYLEELDLKIKDGQLDRVIGAINALQETPWKINAQVYEVARSLWDVPGDCRVLAAKSDSPTPTKPLDIRTNRDARREWAKAAAPIKQANTKNRSKRLQVAKTLWLAEKFKDEAAIYFPHQTDFRGRCYPVNAYLQPQGTDFAKGLLTFSRGMAIETEEAADWLAIHGANVWGEDKCGLQARIDWVHENAELIISCALQPLDDLRWQDADKPWQFLAWCFEWNAYIEQGFGFVSHIPVALDGSCNGLQHFSAMLRDPVGGKAVNLIPSEVPQDIYQEVANVVIRKLMALDHSYAKRWLDFGINRKCTKRPVMVLPYGGTKHSCLSFIADWFDDRLDTGLADPFPEMDGKNQHGPACFWLGAHVWESIGEVVQCAKVAMKWLQDTAKIICEEELPINWTSPSGFPVHQEYHKTIQKKTNIYISERRHVALLSSETDEIDKIRQKNGISPNFVHSLDAANMVMTVNRMVGHGVSDFAMIHDSYGTHAANTELLGKVLRNTFVRMYEEDVMENFRQEVGMCVDKPLPPCPPRGTLNLKDIEASVFFFA